MKTAETQPLPNSSGFRVLSRCNSDPGYSLRMAQGVEDLQALQSLRFSVFNIELGEGLSHSHLTGRDEDPYDSVCDHLIVQESLTGAVVGTYRMQTGENALLKLGYYSEQEFDLAPYSEMRSKIIELGRACVHSKHRNLAVLAMLWKGIAEYAEKRGARYLIGCSSINSQDPATGASVYFKLRQRHLAAREWQTVPRAGFEIPETQANLESAKIPKLLSAYLSLGAKISGPPAIDRTFLTIDFLTVLDLESISRGMLDLVLSRQPRV